MSGLSDNNQQEQEESTESQNLFSDPSSSFPASFNDSRNLSQQRRTSQSTHSSTTTRSSNDELFNYSTSVEDADDVSSAGCDMNDKRVRLIMNHTLSQKSMDASWTSSVSTSEDEEDQDQTGRQYSLENSSTFLPIIHITLPKEDASLCPPSLICEAWQGEDVSIVASSPNETNLAVGCYSGKILLFHLHRNATYTNRNTTNNSATHILDQTKHHQQEHDDDNTEMKQEGLDISNPNNFQKLSMGFYNPDTTGPHTTSLKFSPNNQLLAACWESGIVLLFHTLNGSIYRQLHAPPPLRSVCFNSSSTNLAIGGAEGFHIKNIYVDADVDLVDDDISQNDMFLSNQFNRHSSLSFKKRNKSISCISFSLDDTLMAVGMDGNTHTCQGCHIYDTQQFQLHAHLWKNESVWAATFSPTCTNLLAIGGFDKFCLLDASNGQIQHSFPMSGYYCNNISFSKNGTQIFCCSGNGSTVWGYNVNSGAKLLEIRTGEGTGPWSMTCVQGTKLFVAYGTNQKEDVSGSIQVHHIGQDTPELTHSSEVHCCTSSKDGKWLALGFGNGGGFKVYDIATSTEIQFDSFYLADCSAFSLAFAPKSTILAVGGVSEVRLFHVKQPNGGLMLRYDVQDVGYRVNEVCFSQDERQIISVMNDPKLAVVHQISNNQSQLLWVIPIRYNLNQGRTVFCPNTKLLAVMDSTEIQFQSTSLGQVMDGEGEEYLFNTEEELHAMEFTSDGSKMFICVNDQLRTYRFNVEEQQYDKTPIQTIQLDGRAHELQVSSDNQVIAAMLQDSINICSLKEEGRKLYKILGACVGGASFWSKATTTPNLYHLFTSYGQYTYSTKIDLNSGINPTSFHSLLKAYPDSTMIELTTNHKNAALERNDECETLISAAAKANRIDLVDALVQRCPQHSFAREGVITYLSKKNSLKSLNLIFGAKCVPLLTEEFQTKEMANCLEILSKNRAIDTVCSMLDACPKNCVDGFIRGKLICLLDPSSTEGPSLGNNLPPETSKSLAYPTIFDKYDIDSQKRLPLNQVRVLLPSLSSFKALTCLIETSSLQPFHKPSLRASIDANWERWARRRFLFQFSLYLFWLSALTVSGGALKRVEDNQVANLSKYVLHGFVLLGWLYFAHLEFQQAKKQNIKQYLFNGWNIRQMISLVLVLVSFCLEYTIPSSEITKYVVAFSISLAWINIFYYARGQMELSWIVYALIKIITQMIRFIGVLLVVIFAFSLFFWIIEEPDEYGPLWNRFSITFSAALFSEFEHNTEMSNTKLYIKYIANILVLVIITLICLNAMIAFISEAFSKILNDRDAILSRERACIIVDLYCGMRKDTRNEIERENRWTFKLLTQALLDNVDSNNTDKENNKDSKVMVSTKADIAEMKSDILLKLCSETNEMKKENKDLLDTELTHLGNENQEVKSDMAQLRLENENFKAEMVNLCSGKNKEVVIEIAKLRAESKEVIVGMTLLNTELKTENKELKTELLTVAAELNAIKSLLLELKDDAKKKVTSRYPFNNTRTTGTT